VLGGARGTNEDAYLWALLAKGVLRTDNVDAQLGDGLPADFVLGMPRARIADLERAGAIVVLDHDLRDAVPVLALRLRRAVVELKVPLVDLAPVEHPLSARAAFVSRTLPGAPIDAKVRDEIEKTKGFVGTGGIVNMSPTDHMGLDLSAFHMLEIKNGDWTLVPGT